MSISVSYSRVLVHTAVWLALGASSAVAQKAIGNAEWKDCTSGELEKVVRGCSLIVDSKEKLDQKRRAFAYLNRGSAYFERRDLKKALADFDQSIDLDKSNAYAFFNRGLVHFELSNADAAVVDLDRALDLDPKLGNALTARGNALRMQRKLDEAIKDYTAAIKLSPKSAHPFNGRGNALREQGKYAEAIADYSEAIKLEPRFAGALIGRGNAYRDSGDIAKAFKDYEAAIALDPASYEAYSNRGTAHLANGNFEQAVNDYGAAIRLNLVSAPLYFNRGLAYRAKGDLPAAIADFDSAIRVNPDYDSAYLQRGQAHHLSGQLDKALADYDKATALQPNAAQSRELRAYALLEQGNLGAALTELDTSLKLNPRRDSAYIGRGLVHQQTGDFRRARDDFDAAISVNPRSAAAFVKRGKVFQLLGDTDRAEQDYRAALRVDPDYAEAQQVLKELSPARIEVAIPAKATRLNRVALVIGNDSYQSVPRLNNPSRDAAAVAESLRNIGFRTVIHHTDLSRDALVKALRDFQELADAAEWSVVYYAGHGIEVNGVNYIIPVDARLKSDRDVQDEAVPLPRVLAAVENSRQLKLVILDACRDNPFLGSMARTVASRSIGRGLAPVEPEGGTLIAYAAKHGQVALDGDDNHSPFVTALLRRLATPGLELRKLFGLVRDDVLQTTARRQEPFIYGTLGGDDYIWNPL